jgi:hypothetical protein
MKILLEYLRVLSRDWVSLMSGISAVVLAILGAIFTVPRSALWIAAVLCYVLSTFRMWKKERDEKVELQTKLETHKRWEFQAEFVAASRSVYAYKNGNAPSLSVWIRVRVHNRNPQPTTVFPRGISVQLKNTIDNSFQRATIFPGAQIDFDNPEEYTQFELAGSSTVELLFFAKRYNPPQIEEYLLDAPMPITLELGETFGRVCNLLGPLELGGVER